jgi:flotillin
MTMETLLVLLGIGALAVVSIGFVVSRLIYICQPNMVLVFSGTHRRIGSRQLGYRLVQGGRGIRIPLLEKVDSMDLTNMIIDIHVAGAYSKGGIPLTIQGVANVKVASEEPAVANAIERFLGKPRQEIVRVAKETLEGNLRGVLATLTPEEVNHDRVKFAQSLLHEADHDLKRLGLVLDTLKIQNVSDDKGYLNSIGRKQSAELQMRSRVAEVENQALAAERAAKNFEDREIARLEAQFSISQAEAQRRILEAQTKKDALVAEERARVSSEVARVKAERAVQTARIEQVRLKLQADRVKPAEAKLQMMISNAQGASARIVEEGKATARSLEEIAKTYLAAGDHARQVFVAQKLSQLVDRVLSTVGSGTVDKITLLDSRLGQGGGDFVTKATVASEQLKETLGVDLPALLMRVAGGVPPSAGALPELKTSALPAKKT